MSIHTDDLDGCAIGLFICLVSVALMVVFIAWVVSLL